MIATTRQVKNVMDMSIVAVLAVACGGGGDAPPESSAGAPAPLSLVVIGDSIASGEGIAYGYTYVTSGLYWTGGVANPVWQGKYQLCHATPQAYGDVVATMVGASLAKFACTGSTYDNGILFERRYLGTTYRPAQFGNWFGGTQVNAAYDAAKPDVVIAGHEWCTTDPWAYGLSVLLLNSKSLAPSHPTPEGQMAIAKVVKAALPAR